jgi:hypothetical protein
MAIARALVPSIGRDVGRSLDEHGIMTADEGSADTVRVSRPRHARGRK